jgi:hypothetical protein
MIDRQQLSDALLRLPARDREVLELSLRRRVPDADLAAVFAVEEQEVAGLRGAAIERLSEDLGVQRGEDLGHMLKALLEPDTWAAASPPEAASGPAPESADAPAASEPGHRHVLGMLEQETDPPAEEPASGLGRRVATALAVAAAVLVPAVMIVAFTTGGAESSSGGNAGDGAARPFTPERLGIGEPFPSDPESANRYPVALVRGRTALRASPGGKVKVRIRGKTEWGSPRVLGVVKRRGDWLAVLVPELPNHEVAWIRESRVSRLSTVAWSLHADLSRRRLVVRRNGKAMRTVKIGVGRAGHATPVGRFAVTDKLRVNSKDSPYGCCVLALTGHQTRLPEGWPGGDRLAVHATRDTGGLGRAVSLGCMRSHPRDARWMLKTVPLGAPVFVKR